MSDFRVRGMPGRGMEEGVLPMIPLPIIALTSPLPFEVFAPFCGESMEVALLEQLTRHAEFSGSSPIKPNQA